MDEGAKGRCPLAILPEVRNVADYRLSAKVISRSQGRSATAAAAYRSASQIADERTGEIHDYTRKGGVEWTGIRAPEDAPSWAYDREKLWNAVEAAETRKNSQVAREIQLSLPHELNFEQRKLLVCAFVEQELVGRGMTADIAMHKPERRGDQRNFHAHILITTREIGPVGMGAKNRDWNKVETLAALRASWADLQNAHLRQHLGPNAPQVSHLSYADRDAERVPTQHLGPDATAMERRGVDTEKGSHNRSVRDRNDKIKASRARQKEIETTLEKRVEWTLGQVSLKARLEFEDQVKVANAARFELTVVLEQQKTMREQFSKARLRRDVLGKPFDDLKTAKRDLFEAKKDLANFDERVGRLDRRAASLQSWIKNPRRMLWKKLAEIRERDKILARINDRAGAVLKWQVHLSVRKEWLASSEGQKWLKLQQEPLRALRTTERKLRRNAANAERKAGQARNLSEYARHLDRAAATNGLPRAVQLSENPVNPGATFNDMAKTVTALFRRLPLDQQANLSRTVSQTFSGRGRGIAD